MRLRSRKSIGLGKMMTASARLPTITGESAVELVGSPHRHELQLNCERPGRSVRGLQHVSCRALAVSVGMPERGHTGGIGQCLLEQTQTLADELRPEERQARNVAAWPR